MAFSYLAKDEPGIWNPPSQTHLPNEMKAAAGGWTWWINMGRRGPIEAPAISSNGMNLPESGFTTVDLVHPKAQAIHGTVNLFLLFHALTNSGEFVVHGIEKLGKCYKPPGAHFL